LLAVVAVGIIPTRQKTQRRKKVLVFEPPALQESKKDPPRWVFFVGTVLLATNIDIALLDGACDGVHFSIKI